MSQLILQTERLSLRRFDIDDAPFIYELLNQPAFKEFIGDKGVSSLQEAETYIEDGPLTSYRKYGFGPYLAEDTALRIPVGMNGFFKRDNLDQPDIGFAFLERYFRQGFAMESALGLLQYARDSLGLPEVVAIVDDQNGRSIGLIEKLGFEFQRIYRMPGEDKDLRYYVCRLNDDTRPA